MASTRQLTRLFDALRGQNLLRARQIADEIVDETEGRGHLSAARALRSALRAQGHTLLAPVNDLPLPEALARVSGPPGCGKSVTARALGATLGLPVYVVRIDGILGSLLGQTSGRLHEVFRFAERTPCILLLDELDAIGRRRGDRQDVAEIDRVVVGLMQELDYTTIPGLVVATTNFIEAVDDALARRFDLQLSFPRPDAAALRDFLRERSRGLGAKLRVDRLVNKLPKEASYADAERLLFDEVRLQALTKLARGSADGAEPKQ
jgi:SpoVK/Ycf46/Vps4 family AAA+-type ATPase